MYLHRRLPLRLSSIAVPLCCVSTLRHVVLPELPGPNAMHDASVALSASRLVPVSNTFLWTLKCKSPSLGCVVLSFCLCKQIFDAAAAFHAPLPLLDTPPISRSLYLTLASLHVCVVRATWPTSIDVQSCTQRRTQGASKGTLPVPNLNSLHLFE